MKIKRYVLTRLATPNGITIGGFHVPGYALTRSTRGSVPITGQTLRVRREFVNSDSGRGIAIP